MLYHILLRGQFYLSSTLQIQTKQRNHFFFLFVDKISHVENFTSVDFRGFKRGERKLISKGNSKQIWKVTKVMEERKKIPHTINTLLFKPLKKSCQKIEIRKGGSGGVGQEQERFLAFIRQNFSLLYFILGR